MKCTLSHSTSLPSKVSKTRNLLSNNFIALPEGSTNEKPGVASVLSTKLLLKLFKIQFKRFVFPEPVAPVTQNCFLNISGKINTSLSLIIGWSNVPNLRPVAKVSSLKGVLPNSIYGVYGLILSIKLLSRLITGICTKLANSLEVKTLLPRFHKLYQSTTLNIEGLYTSSFTDLHSLRIVYISFNKC
ncbi:Uncharacterised protein [Staphylococcus aureus]|nr:Uncharacterised protein [Staphylococcus aureus]